MNHETCPSCNSVAVTDDKAYAMLSLSSAPISCTIQQCSACGLRWLKPYPVMSESDSLYDSDYYTSSIAGGVPYSDEKSELEACYRKTAERFISLGVPENLLDVGCGTGDFLAVARKHGLKGEGVEPSSFAASEAVARGIRVHHGPVTDLLDDRRTFSAIHCSHVLEHSLDVHDFLSGLHDLLEPGAPIYLEVPLQFDGILDRINSFRSMGIAYTKHSIHHHYFFNPRVMKELLQKHAFQVLSVDTHLPCRRALRRQNIRTWLLQSILFAADKLAKRGDIISVWARKFS